MHVITTTWELGDVCARLAAHPFVALDTEFLRETTYWPKLCLVQAAAGDVEALIDPLAEGLDLAPLLDLLLNPAVAKVFHAARQDLEIFFKLLSGRMPAPIFDTQIAAMALGYGEQVAYDSLVQGELRRSIDKSHRFTDWSRRPLSDAQLAYALADVTHLRDLYPGLVAKLTRKGRLDWVGEEAAAQADPALYDTDPDIAWQRLKPRKFTPEYLAALKAAAAWRERFAQERDIPRGRAAKDDALMEIAEQRPRSVEALGRLRALPKGFNQSRGGQELAAALDAALADPAAYAPRIARGAQLPNGIGATVELLKVLLRHVCDAEGVAPKLLASVADLERIAADDAAEVKALKGWRREVFGEKALALKAGRLALTLEGRKLRVVERMAVEAAA